MLELAFQTRAQRLQALARHAAHQHRVRVAQAQLVAFPLVEQIDLVQHQYPRALAGADLLQRLLDRVLHRLGLTLGRRGVEHVGQQVGAAGLLQRRAERIDQLVRQLADEPDRVAHEILPSRLALSGDRSVAIACDRSAIVRVVGSSV